MDAWTRRRLLALAGGAGLAACVAPPAADEFFGDDLGEAEFGPRPAGMAADKIFLMDAAMEAYTEDVIVPAARRHGLPDGLYDALYAEEQLLLNYDAAYTRNAREAFAARAGNCLSLVIMTAAFAKRLNLEIRYQQVRIDELWARDGDLLQLIGHVNISLSTTSLTRYPTHGKHTWVTIDFIPVTEAQRDHARDISEQRMIAMYFNNRCAEEMVAGKLRHAYWWGRSAIEHDRSFGSAFISLGVVVQRAGHSTLAERLYRHALALNPRSLPAQYNLVGALRDLGREAEAAALARRLHARAHADPLELYRAGIEQLRAGDTASAAPLLRDALALAPGDRGIHFALGLTYSMQGDKARAAEHFAASGVGPVALRADLSPKLALMKIRALQALSASAPSRP